MGKIELEALRKRARAAGVDPGALVRARRRLLAVDYRPSRQTGLNPPPAERLRPSVALDMSRVRRWVVAVCKPSLALGVADDLNDLGFVAYCPLGRRVIFRGRVKGSNARKKRIHQFAVFGRYLFVGEVDEPLQASIHDGILSILGDSLGHWSLSPDVVELINKAELAGKWDGAPAGHPFKNGHRVRIVGGFMAGFDGLVIACEEAGIRVKFKMLGKETSTIFEPKALELV